MRRKRVSTTRWNSTGAAVDTVMLRYKELVLDALTELSGHRTIAKRLQQQVGSKNDSRTFV